MACRSVWSPTTAGRCACRTPLRVVAAASSANDGISATAPAATGRMQRRACLAAVAAAAAPLLARPSPAAAAEEAPAITILADEPGSGSATARQGDLCLLHYVGRLEDGRIFDSTRGGQKYRDGGNGQLRPVAITLGGSPVPGLCAGLLQGLQGMRVGGRRTISVPPALGFGGQAVLAPYGAVPAGSQLLYEVELLRLSRRGPDALFSGISQCGGGFANERTAGCASIEPAEFV